MVNRKHILGGLLALLAAGAAVAALAERDDADELPAEAVKDDLEHVRKWPAEHWKLAFQGQLRTVSDADAALLLDRLRAAAGAPAPSPEESASAEGLRVWLARALALPRFVRPTAHPGQHRYLLPLTRAARKAAGASLPYPRVSRAALDACPTFDGGPCVSPCV